MSVLFPLHHYFVLPWSLFAVGFFFFFPFKKKVDRGIKPLEFALSYMAAAQVLMKSILEMKKLGWFPG
jgi:hypothetical protein